MAGVYGTAQLEKLAVGAANIVNNAFRGGLVGGLGILSALSDVKDVDFTAAGKEVKELDAEDRSRVEVAFNKALSLENKAVEAKIEAGVSMVDDGFILAAEAVELYNGALAFIAKGKAVLGL